jgi:formyltetrahydrofolate deformylase
MPEYVLTLRCPDTAGIVYAVSVGLLACGSNILDQAQFTDPDLGLFCLRTRFESPEGDLEVVHKTLEAQIARFAPDLLEIRPTAENRRILVMLSRFDHCLVDLLYRRQTGELQVDIPVVVSNHEDCRSIVEAAGIRFEHVPVTPETKAEAEQRLRELVAENDVDVVVLARYMQVLSDTFCSEMPGRIVNIHHSFLPGFKGARPYHQAHERGVKIIGATAHYVTADLDEGPIIEQDVQRVTHAATAEDFVAVGRDVERRVLSRAVRLVAEDRVMLTGVRTVVFD